MAVYRVTKKLFACGENGATYQNCGCQPEEVLSLTTMVGVWLKSTNLAKVNVVLEMSIASALDLKKCFSPPSAA